MARKSLDWRRETFTLSPPRSRVRRQPPGAGSIFSMKSILRICCRLARQRRRGVVLLANFLWQPLDAGTIAMGVKLIDPDFRGADFNLLYPH